MPPNGKAGASTKSYFANGYGRSKYRSIHSRARRLSAISVSRSASLAREARTKTLMVRPFTVDDARCHGPAANAMRYVLSGFVSAKWCVSASAAVSDRARDPLATTVHDRGARRLKVTRALRSGWSKHGKSWLASAGTSRVYR